MRLLLDTHVVLWRLAGARQLGTRARATIAAVGELAFSVVSFAEIGVKPAVGSFAVPGDFHPQLLAAGLRSLGLARTRPRHRDSAAASPRSVRPTAHRRPQLRLPPLVCRA